jgi:serine/threonine protein kinase
VVNSNLQGTLAELSWNDFECTDVLGEGASGVIYKATRISTGTKVAIKLFKGRVTSDGSPSKSFRGTRHDLIGTS